jgi:hypothetical protein
MKSAFYFTLIFLVLAAIGFIAFYIQASDIRDSLANQLASANTRISSLEQENANLQETIRPTEPMHNLSSEEFNISSTYWNLAWEGRDAELQRTVKETNAAYYEWHTYIANETDCNDMAVDIWDMLRRKGIISLIAEGNLEIENETFSQCNHAWLVILNSSGAAFSLEPTNGQLYFTGDSRYEQYRQFFLYAKPSDLRADLGSRW